MCPVFSEAILVRKGVFRKGPSLLLSFRKGPSLAAIRFRHLRLKENIPTHSFETFTGSTKRRIALSRSLSVSISIICFYETSHLQISGFHHGSRVWICWAHLGSSFLMWYELWLQSSGGSTGLECPRGLTEGSTDLECPRWWQLELPKGWDFLWGCQSEHFDLPSYVIFKWLPWAFLKVW